ncbi:MAG: hypothetical protein ACLQJ0_07400 [Steroidobacteraceae bacterium]
MNAITGGQSLLLAGEQIGSSGRPSSPIGEALSLITSGATLKRVTLVTEQPHSTVVLVRADYSAANEQPPATFPPAPQTLISREPIDVSWTDVEVEALPGADSGGGELTTLSPAPGMSLYTNPLGQYARTQGGQSAAPKGVHLDVHA